jgi:hypothetical protein
MDWYFYEVHQRYNRYIHVKRGREGGENFLRVVTSPFLNRQVLRNRFSSPPVLGPYIPEQSVRHHYFGQRGLKT